MTDDPIFVRLPKDDVARAIACAASNPSMAHLVPIYRAMRDHGIGYLTVTQDAGRFWPLKGHDGRPCLVILGDDLATSRGPPAFHARSLSRLFRECVGAVIVACGAHPRFYEEAVTAVITERRHVALIECLPSTQDAWLAIAKRYGIRTLLGAVRGQEPQQRAGRHLGDLGDLPQEAMH